MDNGTGSNVFAQNNASPRLSSQSGFSQDGEDSEVMRVSYSFSEAPNKCLLQMADSQHTTPKQSTLSFQDSYTLFTGYLGPVS